jgi:formylglycine-generating enzyme required for sulfatase activity
MFLLSSSSFGLTYAIVASRRPPTVAPAKPAGMVWIPGGEFVMGNDAEPGWAEERPEHRVRIDGFWMDETEVTNAQFRRFVDATGYITTAETAPSAAEIMAQMPPGTKAPPAESLVAGSLVFTMTDGPDSDLKGRDDHPAVHISWDDAVAYAKWAGKRLPTEAEWEFAARGGLARKPYIWGDEAPSETQIFANIWQGEFPHQNSAEDGFVRTSPAKSFAANGYGLYDMAGNVWEWCRMPSPTSPSTRQAQQKASILEIHMLAAGPNGADPSCATMRIARGIVRARVTDCLPTRACRMSGFDA